MGKKPIQPNFDKQKKFITSCIFRLKVFHQLYINV